MAEPALTKFITDTDDEAEDEDSGDEQVKDIGFKYIPLEEDSKDSNGEMDPVIYSRKDLRSENSCDNGILLPGSSNRGGYASSGCDSSDIEVIHESSDSIEVIDTEKMEDSFYNGAVDGINDNQNVERLKLDNEEVLPLDNEGAYGGDALDNVGAGERKALDNEHDEGIQLEGPSKEDQPKPDMHAKMMESVHGDTSSTHESLSSDTGTLKSNSSTCSNMIVDDVNSPSQPAQKQTNIDAEAREIFAAIDALDRDRSDMSDSPASSSVSPSPYDSPSHRPLIPLEPNIVTLDRPDSLSLPRSLQYYEKRRLMKKDSSASSLSEFSSRSSSMDALIEAAILTPLQVQGVVTTEGDMVAFVASGLQDMIRMSSPLSRKDSSGASYSGNLTPKSMTSMSSSASGWSTSSASGWSYSGLSRSPSLVTQSPEDIPPIDPRALMDLEVYARRVASSLDHMMCSVKTNLFKMSSITYGCLDAYRDGIDHTCDTVDSGIKSMYALMAKCEELSKRIKPIYQLKKDVEEINRLLDLFEAQMLKNEKPPG